MELRWLKGTLGGLRACFLSISGAIPRLDVLFAPLENIAIAWVLDRVGFLANVCCVRGVLLPS